MRIKWDHVSKAQCLALKKHIVIIITIINITIVIKYLKSNLRRMASNKATDHLGEQKRYFSPLI